MPLQRLVFWNFMSIISIKFVKQIQTQFFVNIKRNVASTNQTEQPTSELLHQLFYAAQGNFFEVVWVSP